MQKELLNFKKRVLKSKVNFWYLISKLIIKNKKIVGISAPSRASTMINYLGIDENIVSYICEKKGSLKIGKFIPGTKIKVINEDFIIKDQPDFAVIFSWHIYKDLIKILKKRVIKANLSYLYPNQEYYKLKKLFFIILITAALMINLKADEKGYGKCQDINTKAEIFCKSTISQTFVILKRYSGIENDKKKKLEHLKCERFKMTFPSFCKIVIDKYKQFIAIFFLIFLISYFTIKSLKKKYHFFND